VLILNSLIWASGCTPDPIRVKPNGALTIPMDKEIRDETDTPRTLLIKFELNNEAIDEGNKRFEQLRK